MHASNTPAPNLTTATPKPAVASTETTDTSGQLASSEPQPETPNSKPKTNSVRLRWKKFVLRRGRPTLLTEEVADAMYEAILDFGVTDSRAALLAHVSTTTVSRWKQEDPIFADFLETARTEFECGEVKKIRSARRRDGQLNPQNSKWLLERTNPEVWGRHATRPPASADRPRTVRDVPQRDANGNAQQSNLTQNIPEIRQRTYEAQQAAAMARIAEIETARFHAIQQSKPTPNIPEIPQPTNPISEPEAQQSAKQLDLPSRAETAGARLAPLAARIAPAARFTVGSYSPASAPHDLKELFASLSCRRAA